MAIKNLGGKLGWVFDEILRMRKLVENLEVDKYRDGRENKKRKDVTSF